MGLLISKQGGLSLQLESLVAATAVLGPACMQARHHHHLSQCIQVFVKLTKDIECPALLWSMHVQGLPIFEPSICCSIAVGINDSTNCIDP